MDVMCVRQKRLVAVHGQNPLSSEMIPRIHIEGPFLNETPGYPGAHPIDAIKPANVDDAKRLFDASEGLLRLFTLAPERDPDFATTTWLAEQGITVSAGHTDASLDHLQAAADAGLSMVTHVGNGCPSVGMHRHDNIV